MQTFERKSFEMVVVVVLCAEIMADTLRSWAPQHCDIVMQMYSDALLRTYCERATAIDDHDAYTATIVVIGMGDMAQPGYSG